MERWLLVLGNGIRYDAGALYKSSWLKRSVLQPQSRVLRR